MSDSLETTTNREILSGKLLEILNDINPPYTEKATGSSLFDKDLNLDSMHRFEYAAQVEETLKTQISDRKVNELNSVDEYVKYIQEYRNVAEFH